MEGRVAVVTGGGGGICSAIAYGLAEFGADIVLLDVDIGNLVRVRDFLKGRFPGRRVEVFQMDVTRVEEVSAVVDKIAKDFGRIDILVNCHGIGQWIAAEDMGLED